MIVIIPLGGIGERFKNNNYKLPKALIKIFGKPIIYYLLDFLNLDNIDMVYIPYNPIYSKYRFEDMLYNRYPHIPFKFLNLNKNTEGASETINIALKELNIEDKPILCLDADNFYDIDIITRWNGQNRIFTIIDNTNSSIFSYIKIDENNTIKDILEKNKISNLACTGAYGFNSYKNLLKYTNYIIKNNIRYKNEFYISTAIKECINNGEIFLNDTINFNNWHCLGTPVQLKLFYNNYPCISSFNKKNMISKMRICFDLDNTLVTFPKIKNDYTSVEPIHQNINMLKYLKKMGHTIIIYTARRMKTTGGNIGKVMNNIGKITFDTLEKFKIEYDEIYFGKPHADIYIDDLALNCYDNIEKELGFYMDDILSRDFNSIDKSMIDTIIKKSSNLSGEIFYYNNIPNEIKDLFPILIDYDTDNQWYIIEKIKGISVTSLYLDELLTTETLICIMNSLSRIHNVNINNSIEINIYDNYSKKLINRYNSFDYSAFDNSEKIFNYINNKLLYYETKNYGIKSVIHGDPVMTNVLINNFGKIKFIDMRGKIEDNNTIYGDVMYDWAKLYQSLIGYDSILQNKNVNINYKQDMLKTFEKYFLSKFDDNYYYYLKIITASLLFTLIPLHNNPKCNDYYNLIKVLNLDF